MIPGRTGLRVGRALGKEGKSQKVFSPGTSERWFQTHPRTVPLQTKETGVFTHCLPPWLVLDDSWTTEALARLDFLLARAHPQVER